MIPTREQAWALLQEYNQSPALLTHGLAVEGAMRHFAQLLGEGDRVDLWGAVGLLHDLDYEQYPDQHCHKTQEILEERGMDPAFVRAIVSHGYGICTQVEPLTPLEKTLYTIDELTGLIAAAALMRPSRSVLDLELSSLKKKYKDKRFAAGVNRQVIQDGCTRLGMDLDTVITETILGMRACADALGLGMGE